MLLEDDVRELMHNATDDVSAPIHVGSSIATAHRRRQTRRAVTSLALTGLTVGAVAVATYPHGSSSPGRAQLDPATASPSTNSIHLTAAQRTLIGLSEVAAKVEPPSGRYVIMSEIQDRAQRTSVIDAITGDVWTYQHGAGVPNGLAVARHFSPTEAQFDAIPTGRQQLRDYLIGQFDNDQRKALAEERPLPTTGPKPVKLHPDPVHTADDKVFEQATDMLWNPMVGPQLRSALFRVLAGTSGVQVDPHAVDAEGRAAVKISRYDASTEVTAATFESPTTSRVLQTTYNYADGTTGSDLYLSTSRADVVPADPYPN